METRNTKQSAKGNEMGPQFKVGDLVKINRPRNRRVYRVLDKNAAALAVMEAGGSIQDALKASSGVGAFEKIARGFDGKIDVAAFVTKKPATVMQWIG